MKKLVSLLILGLIGISKLDACPVENEQFGYGSLGSIGGYPTIGGGYRLHKGYHGFDISGKFMPWILPPAAEIRGMYLLYPRQKGIYLGSGFGCIWEKEVLRSCSASFDAVIGYQWETKKGRHLFFELEGIVPFNNNSRAPIWPAFTFGIGF